MPKPFIPLLGPKTLIQQTVERLLPAVPPERLLISIGEAQREAALGQLPQIPPGNFIVEPVGRDTAPCLGFCALHIERRDPEGILLAVPADHFIADAAAYRRTLEKGLQAVTGAAAVVFGIRPHGPETGYGYIQVEKTAAEETSLPVLRFVEKPDRTRAQEYVASGNFFWNSGIFLWRNRVLLELLERHMPELHRGLDSLRRWIGREEMAARIAETFASLPRISIDFGIMEKAEGTRLVRAEFGWDDIGNWKALERALPPDIHGNVVMGSQVAVDAGGCICYSDEGTVAVFGVSGLIVVQARGKVLVCAKERAGDLKRLIAALGPSQRG
jgi:mannose-1-phosphate guanylyltransferase